MATGSVRVPWVDDLMPTGLAFDDPKRVASAAENVTLPLTNGVKAIGKLLVSASGNSDDPPSPETLSDLGYLLEVMGEVLFTLDVIESNARFQLDDPSTAAKMLGLLNTPEGVGA